MVGTQDSPRKTPLIHSGRFSNQPTHVSKTRAELRRNMARKFQSVPVETFMKDFAPLPRKPSSRGKPPKLLRPGKKMKMAWKRVFGSLKVRDGMPEEELQDTVVAALEQLKPFGNDYEIVSSPNLADKTDPAGQKEDCGIYPKADAPKDGRPSWSTKALSIEFKSRSTAHDPFNEWPGKDFEADAITREEARGQIIQYASEIFLRQQRCFHFSIIIIGIQARIIRWDRSGAAVTKLIDYTTDCTPLCEFLWRFGRMSPSQQGYDTTAVRLYEGDADYGLMDDMSDAISEDQTTDYIRRYFKASLAAGWLRYRVEVPVNDEAAVDGGEAGESATGMSTSTATREFLICKPHFHEPSVIGRGTRGYVAVDCASKTFVFLKDSWRVDLPGIDKEGDVLQQLNAAGVESVPTVLCHGDIRGQRTETQDYWVKLPTGPQSNPCKEHRHTRLVENEVGEKLDGFINGQDLVLVILDCIAAHQDAYEQCGILHRDISIGNILMVRERRESGKYVHRGLLNDWELSKKVPKTPEEEAQPGRQPDRTGTWLFLSALSLQNKWKKMVIQDDLESFFHVLLYMAIRYLPSNCEDVPKFIEKFFESAEVANGELVCGEKKFSAMLSGEVLVNTAQVPLKFYAPDAQAGAAPIAHPINDIFEKLLCWFGAYYRQNRLRQNQEPSTAVTIRSDPTAQTSSSDTVHLLRDRHTKRKKAPLDDDYDAQKNIRASQQRQEDEALAKRLESHSFMFTLLHDSASKNGWPKDEKVRDQAVGAGRLRRTRDDPEPVGRPYKRSRYNSTSLGRDVLPPLSQISRSDAGLVASGSGSRARGQSPTRQVASGSGERPSSLRGRGHLESRRRSQQR